METVTFDIDEDGSIVRIPAERPSSGLAEFYDFLLRDIAAALGIPERLLSTGAAGHPCPCVGAGSLSEDAI